MKRLVNIFIICAFGAMIVSCSKTEDTTTPATPGPKFLAAKAVITSSCALSGCHTGSSASGGLNLESDASIVDHKAQIKSYAVDMGSMPPSSPLSSAAKTAITDWINAGGRLTD